MTPEPAGHAPNSFPATLGSEVARDLLYLGFQARFLEARVRDLARSEVLHADLAGFRVDPRSTVLARAMRGGTDGKGDLCHPGPLAPGPALAFGATPLEFLRHLAGKGTSSASAREGGLSWTDLRRGIIGWGAPRGGTATQVLAGAAFAFRQRGEDRAALVFERRSALQSGGWHEGVNLAGALGVPLIVVLAAPQTGDGSDHADIEAVAASYGIAFARVGRDSPERIFPTVAAARRRAVNGEGPTLIELLDAGDGNRWEHHDAFAELAVTEDGLPEQVLDAIRKAAAAGVEHAAARLAKEPGPSTRDALVPVCTDAAPHPPWTRRDPPAPDTPAPNDAMGPPHAE
ncbi:MAG: thiamine pyrophosphate-dependent enzyme [Gemmatimonadota bacterium]|nr:thiamine pyrophosphate-dependent enzyme [Gemmatimonadota bacterium]